MDHVLRLDAELAARAFDQMRQVEVEETGMDTFVTSFEEIGRARGRAEGLAEGQLQGQRELIMHLLDRKVGSLTAELQEQITALTGEQLLRLSEALFDFTSIDDLTAWLAQQAPASAE
jgi:predicted transposase YdaD